MKKLLLCILLSIFPLFGFAQEVLEGEYTIGGGSNDGGYSLIKTNDGGYAVVGYSSSFGAGGGDVYVLKFDSFFNLQWTRTVGGASNDAGLSVIQTSDNGYAIAGYSDSYGAGGADVYIIKLDYAGNMMWTKTIGGTSDDFGESIVQTNDGGYAIVGTTRSFGYKVYVVKLDINGNLVWTKTIGGKNLDEGYSIIQTRDGGLAITGVSLSFGDTVLGNLYVLKLDSIGNLKWTKTIGGANADAVGYSIIQTKEGGYAIAGQTNSYGPGYQNVYIVKLDSIGDLTWTKTIGDTGGAAGGNVIIQTKDGGYVIDGWTDYYNLNERTMFIMKLDSLGNFTWSPDILGGEASGSVLQSSDGGYVTAGNTLYPGEQVFIIKLDSSGKTCELLNNFPYYESDGGMITTSDSGRIGSGGSITSSDSGMVSSGGNFITLCQVTGIENIPPTPIEIKTFPNPCFNILNIDFETQPNLSCIQIMDITGRVLLTDYCQLTIPKGSIRTDHYSLDVSSLSPGMYFLRLNSPTSTEIKQFIKVE